MSAAGVETHAGLRDADLLRKAIEEVVFMLRALQSKRAEPSLWSPFARVERRSLTWGIRSPAPARRL